MGTATPDREQKRFFGFPGTVSLTKGQLKFGFHLLRRKFGQVHIIVELASGSARKSVQRKMQKNRLRPFLLPLLAKAGQLLRVSAGRAGTQVLRGRQVFNRRGSLRGWQWQKSQTGGPGGLTCRGHTTVETPIFAVSGRTTNLASTDAEPPI